MRRRRIEVSDPPTRGRIYEQKEPVSNPVPSPAPAHAAGSTKKMELVQMKITRADGSVEIIKCKQPPES